MNRPPPKSPLFPYPTLFRSAVPASGPGPQSARGPRHRLKELTVLRQRRRAQEPFQPPAAYSLARSMYSPVLGLTRTFSPVGMNSGTLMVTPLESLAGLVEEVFVAPRITGDVSTICSVS